MAVTKETYQRVMRVAMENVALANIPDGEEIIEIAMQAYDNHPQRVENETKS